MLTLKGKSTGIRPLFGQNRRLGGLIPAYHLILPELDPLELLESSLESELEPEPDELEPEEPFCDFSIDPVEPKVTTL